MSDKSRVPGGGDGIGPDLLQAAMAKLDRRLLMFRPKEPQLEGMTNYALVMNALRAALTELAAYEAFGLTGYQQYELAVKVKVARKAREAACRAFVGEGV